MAKGIRRVFLALLLAVALLGVSGVASADLRVVGPQTKKKRKKARKPADKGGKKQKKAPLKKKKKPAKKEKSAQLTRDGRLLVGLGAGGLVFGLGVFGSWRLQRRREDELSS